MNQPGAPIPSEPPVQDTRSIQTGGRSLRAFAARGVIVNTAFDVGLSLLGLIRGFVLATLLTRADYGVWGILVVSVGVLAQIKFIGVSDKYIQQDEADQELAFQHAFTLELLATGAAIVPILVALPLVAVVYGHWDLVAPGLAIVTVLIATALQAPLWVYYRRMNFVRQRLLTAIDPIVGFIVAVVLALAGAGYWALVIGVVAGAWSATLAAVLASPYPLRWRYDRASLRVYAAFSGPVFVATMANVVLANATVIAGNAHLGLAGVGAIALANNITAFANRVDDLVSTTLYPAICAMQERLDLLQESFVKTNRLALMWALPFGVGLALFAGDLVRFAIGHKWQPAVGLLQITGLVAAVAHIGFNWDDYFRARAQTVPIAVAAVAATATMLGLGLPLLFSHGLTGLAIGIAAGGAVHLAFRGWYLSRLFDGFGFLRHAARAVLPVVPGTVAVLALRQLESPPRTALVALAELALFIVITAGSTWLVEGALIREAVGYVAGRGLLTRRP